MNETPSPSSPDSHQLKEDFKKFAQNAYAWLLDKIRCLYGMLRGKGAQAGTGKKVFAIFSHWHQLIEGLQESPQHIYGALEEAIQKRNLPDVKISRITHSEAGVLSAGREYLRIQRREHVFDICAAPFGTGFFVSWWLGEARKFSWLLAIILVVVLEIVGLLIRLPWWLPLAIGVVIVVVWRLSFRPTYYRLDTALMFRDSVHTAVTEVMDQTMDAKGLRKFTEEQKKPILKDLFSR